KFWVELIDKIVEINTLQPCTISRSHCYTFGRQKSPETSTRTQQQMSRKTSRLAS
ncbi:unnamed protein product, partial [Linum tenue]